MDEPINDIWTINLPGESEWGLPSHPVALTPAREVDWLREFVKARNMAPNREGLKKDGAPLDAGEE